MEYCPNGTLMDYIIKRKGLIPPKEIFLIFDQILEGLFYLHDKNIVHGDLK